MAASGERAICAVPCQYPQERPALYSTITNKLREISGKGGSGSEGVVGEETGDGVDDAAEILFDPFTRAAFQWTTRIGLSGCRQRGPSMPERSELDVDGFCT